MVYKVVWWCNTRYWMVVVKVGACGTVSLKILIKPPSFPLWLQIRDLYIFNSSLVASPEAPEHHLCHGIVAMISSSEYVRSRSNNVSYFQDDQ